MNLVEKYSETLKNNWTYISKYNALQFLRDVYGNIVIKDALNAYNEVYNY